ncbi:hypothetical protein [Streptomyces sp. 6N223]|uniref:hypothetical protein n=1 Tax=Streptomyces sp. 6N223 TaxID=3457412 RepID=UPI003FD1F5D3
MRVLFKGELWVHYGQFYVESRGGRCGTDLPESFAGQRNGLCGAAAPGLLFLITGLHTGKVGLAVELHEQAPPVDEALEEWEEVVEATFTPGSGRVGLQAWGGQEHWPLGIDAVRHRVRYCGSGMARGRKADTRTTGQPQLDRYLLQFWPAPATAEPDGVVKQTSTVAAYWHRYASRLAPPALPRRSPPEEQGPSRDTAGRARRAAPWPGHPDRDRLREVMGAVPGMAELDAELCWAMAEAAPAAQRAVARWTARRACARAGIAGIDWVAPALAALDEGLPLPSPFDDTERTWRLLWADERVPHTTVTHCNGLLENVSQQAAALPALWGAAEPDPLRAALEALLAAAVTFGADYPVLLEEVRRAFPAATRRR